MYRIFACIKCAVQDISGRARRIFVELRTRRYTSTNVGIALESRSRTPFLSLHISTVAFTEIISEFFKSHKSYIMTYSQFSETRAIPDKTTARGAKRGYSHVALMSFQSSIGVYYLWS